MSLFFWRKNKAIDEFAFQLADALYSNIRPEAAKTFLEWVPADNKNQKKQEQSNQKATRALNDIIIRIHQFRQLHKLGVYGKARLHLTFTERLKELGYADDVAEDINKQILLHTP